MMRNLTGKLSLAAALVLLASLCLGAADMAKPIAGDLYTTTLATLRDNTTALATWFEFGNPANLPVGAKRIDSSTKRVQRWDGATWQNWGPYTDTAASAGTIVLRDGNGRAKVAAGVASDDAVTKGQLDAKANLTQDGQSFTGQQNFVRDNQSSYDTAAIRSLSNAGDVGVGLHAGYVTAAFIKHVRGGNGIEVRDAAGDPARIKAAPGVASDDVLTKGQILHGRGQSSGAATRLPSGWTVQRVAVGAYDITHNLNTTALTVLPGLWADGGPTVGVGTRYEIINANTFRIRTLDGSNVQQDQDWSFFAMVD